MRAVNLPGRGVIGVQIVDRDLTEQHKMAAELHATRDRLEMAQSAAAAAEQRSRLFLADAAHQLRSPMTTIQVCTETLLQGVDDTRRDRLLTDVVRQTARAGRLIASLLRLARLDEGEELAPQPCDLVALCREEADRMWHLAPRLDFGLRARGLPEQRPRLDVGVMRELMSNLLENAVRYAKSQVEMTLGVTAGGVFEVRVMDDGPGLAPGTEERAFERFVTLDAKGNSGLGLSIARELARAHGGDITYEAGAFVVRVPDGYHSD